MKKSPWVPFYPSDWLNGTSSLTLDQAGAYIQIIALLYDNENALPLDRIEHPVTGKLEGYKYTSLARRLNTRADKLERIVSTLLKQQKLSIQGGYLTSSRVGRELAKLEKKSERTRNAAHKRWSVETEKVIKINPRLMR